MIRMVTAQTQFIFQNCIEPEGTFSQTGSHLFVPSTEEEQSPFFPALCRDIKQNWDWKWS